MMTTGQARELIKKSIEDLGGYQKVAALANAAAPDASVTASMLYKYAGQGTSRLGRESVTALAPVLTSIKPEVWLVAMGVDGVTGAPSEAPV